MYYEESMEGYEALLDNIRKLKMEIYERFRVLQDQEISIERRKDLITQNQKAESDLTDLKRIAVFKPRTFDVYLSPVEVAVRKFVDENPEPKTDERCLHLHGTQLRKIYHANHTLHLVKQCKVCGAVTGHAKKRPEINVVSIPFHDPTIFEEWNHNNSAHFRWKRKVNEAAQEARFAGGDIPPEFDYKQFTDAYNENSPEPVQSSMCSHSESQPRYRKYPNSDCVALQCLICGKHLKALKKSEFSNYENLPAFDEDKQQSIDGIFREWIIEKNKAYENAKTEFYKDAQLKLLIGEIEINDNSKFATYYDSEEWYRTRGRIFQRDDYKCRNFYCDNEAECAHHIVYDRLGEEHDFDLISLCHACHREVHFIQDCMPYQYKLKPSEIDQLQSTFLALVSNDETKGFLS